MNTLIKNAAVVFCDGVRVSDILIKNGKIAQKSVGARPKSQILAMLEG